MYKFAHVQICTCICEMIQYLENNAEWLFSVIGITLLSLLITMSIAIIVFRVWLKKVKFKIKFQGEITNEDSKTKQK